MAKQGKRYGYTKVPKTRTRTVVKYRNRMVKVGRRVSRVGSSLAKERGATTLIGLGIGYVDGKRAAGEYQMLNKLPQLPGAGWEATVGAVLHLYHSKNRSAKWADQSSTALLAIAGYKFGRGQAGAAVAGVGGNGDASLSGWMPGPR